MGGSRPDQGTSRCRKPQAWAGTLALGPAAAGLIGPVAALPLAGGEHDAVAGALFFGSPFIALLGLATGLTVSGLAGAPRQPRARLAVWLGVAGLALFALMLFLVVLPLAATLR